MKSPEEIKALAIKTLELEAESVKNLGNYITDTFVEIVQLIYQSEGRVVVTGIGKSAIIANKIVATLNSTGTPATFMHAADAIHGDLGTIQKNDSVICISKSGNTPEIKVLVPLLKTGNTPLIALTGNTNSYLATHADFVMDATVAKEACPNDLAPTCSTTAQLALGDALAVCLLECRNFTSKDFAKYHPGGALGKKLYLKVADISAGNARPFISPDASVKEVIVEISSNRLGAVAVLKDDKIVGIITDGDIRRMLENYSDINAIKARDIMNENPKTISSDILAVKAVEIFKQYNVSQLLIADEDEYKGFVHFHDLLKEGIL